MKKKKEIKSIQFTSGCPNGCEYCYEPRIIKCLSPEIPDDKEIDILDMNFLCNPFHLDILKSLPKKKYNLVCGIDHRRLTPEICDLLKQKGFQKIRWAWDYSYGDQKKHQKIYRMLKKSGYKNYQLMVFVLINWKIPYDHCIKKLDNLKVWNVEISDCCFDGGYKLVLNNCYKFKYYWTIEQIKKFRKLSRKHNQLVNFGGIDPEY